jgi:hypothetical protein
VFENRVPWRIFDLKRDEVTGGWRKLHNEELRNLHFLPSVLRMIKSMRMRWNLSFKLNVKLELHRVRSGKCAAYFLFS